MSSSSNQGNVVITPEDLLNHWQGHRRLTRRVIETFPEDQLFTFSIGGMRPFGQLALELIAMAAPIARGVARGEWTALTLPQVRERQEILGLWDAGTREIDELWGTIPPPRFQEVDTAFGMYEGKGWWHVFYAIDNEIHHRGQGYVYLRALGVEPPPFWER
jgi:uncharacterized damage-inducible protein DinB